MTYKLSELLWLISWVFSQIFCEQWYVIAEITKVTHKKFVYFELVESHDGDIIAKAKWIAFERKIDIDPAQLIGQTVMMTVSARFHAEYGFSLILHDVSMQYLRGAIATQRELSYMTLKNLWIIDANKTLNYTFPMHLSIIASQTSAGLEDFLAILWSDYHIPHTIHHVSVEWSTASAQIQKALNHTTWNLVIIMRGGGSTSSMLRWNDQALAKRICLHPVPVIVAIWHTQDTTLIDDVARHSAKTPSDAAYFIRRLYTTKLQEISWYYSDILSIIQSDKQIYQLYHNIENSISQRRNDMLAHITDRYQYIIPLYHIYWLQSPVIGSQIRISYDDSTIIAEIKDIILHEDSD